MRDTIRLTGVRARGNHGVFDHERADGLPEEFDQVRTVRVPGDGDSVELDVLVDTSSVEAFTPSALRCMSLAESETDWAVCWM